MKNITRTSHWSSFILQNIFILTETTFLLNHQICAKLPVLKSHFSAFYHFHCFVIFFNDSTISLQNSSHLLMWCCSFFWNNISIIIFQKLDVPWPHKNIIFVIIRQSPWHLLGQCLGQCWRQSAILRSHKKP